MGANTNDDLVVRTCDLQRGRGDRPHYHGGQRGRALLAIQTPKVEIGQMSMTRSPASTKAVLAWSQRRATTRFLGTLSASTVLTKSVTMWCQNSFGRALITILGSLRCVRMNLSTQPSWMTTW